MGVVWLAESKDPPARCGQDLAKPPFRGLL